MKRQTLSILLLILLAGLTVACTPRPNMANAETTVNGTITSDTTWTKTNGPYSLLGNVLVSNGVTLTIEPSVHVYFNGYCLQVNGTLTARGSASEPISFIDGEIQFMPSSSDWDEKTGVGSILENVNTPAYTSKITIDDSSPKIKLGDFILSDLFVRSGSPDISNNKINIFTGGGLGFVIEDGSPLISHNNIQGSISVKDGSPVIFNNKITSGLEVKGGNPHISNNEISSSGIGVSAVNGVIERNYIHGGSVGVEIEKGTIRNNTISSPIGIIVKSSLKPTITYNNFEYDETSGKKNIVLAEGVSQDVDVSNNWWGTTNTTIIEQNIMMILA